MKKTGREPQVPGRAGGGGRAGVLLLWAAVGLGAGFINGLLGAAGGILLVTALPYLPTPSLLSVGANPYGQAGADRRDLFASALAVMLPVSAAGGRRSVAPIPAPAVAARRRRRTAGRFPAGADIAAPSAPPVRGGHSGIRHPDAVLRRIDSCC